MALHKLSLLYQVYSRFEAKTPSGQGARVLGTIIVCGAVHSLLPTDRVPKNAVGLTELLYLVLLQEDANTGQRRLRNAAVVGWHRHCGLRAKLGHGVQEIHPQDASHNT